MHDAKNITDIDKWLNIIIIMPVPKSAWLALIFIFNYFNVWPTLESYSYRANIKEE